MPVGSKKVLIIGAGIVGLSAALEAQGNGHQVSIIDPRGFGAGASHGNAGVLAVSECVPVGTPEILRQAPALIFGRNSPLTLRWGYAPFMASWLYRFARSCAPDAVEHGTKALATLLARAQEAHAKLSTAAGSKDQIRQRGWIKAFETTSAFESARSDFDRMREHGVACDYLNAEALLAREPNLNPVFMHAIVQTDCAQVSDPGKYTQSYADEFLRRGGQYIRAEVESLDCRNGAIKGALTRTDRYEADVYVLAAGAWSKKLAADAGTAVPLDTERGYHMILSSTPERMPTAPILWAEHSIVMSPNARGLRVTSSVEFAGLKRRPDFRKLLKKIPDVRRAHAHPPGHAIAEWLGFRPSMPDSLPVIGRAPRADNAIFAFGHGHLGLTLGPLTGVLVGQLIENSEPDLDLAPFSATRF